MHKLEWIDNCVFLAQVFATFNNYGTNFLTKLKWVSIHAIYEIV